MSSDTSSTEIAEPGIAEGELRPDDLPIPPPPSDELVCRDPVSLFELDQRRANLYAESGYWPDAKSQAQALVKIEAGRALGLPAIVAMSEVHVIQGKSTLGAGALAALVKTSGRYDYRIVEHTEQRCTIRFFDLQAGELGESVFTLDDARKAGLASRSTWRQYPRNMLFARALSNGVAWYCPDVSAGRVYTPEELDGHVIVEADLVESETVEGEAIEEPEGTTVDEPPARGHDLRGKIPEEVRPTAAQKAELDALLRTLVQAAPDTDWAVRCREIAGVSWDMATTTTVRMLLEKLQAELRRLVDEKAA